MPVRNDYFEETDENGQKISIIHLGIGLSIGDIVYRNKNSFGIVTGVRRTEQECPARHGRNPEKRYHYFYTVRYKTGRTVEVGGWSLGMADTIVKYAEKEYKKLSDQYNELARLRDQICAQTANA